MTPATLKNARRLWTYEPDTALTRMYDDCGGIATAS